MQMREDEAGQDDQHRRVEGERDAQVLRLSVLEGRSHAEVAALLDVEVAHCRVLLSRAMVRLSK